jgi:hypothetical protein
MRALGRLIPDQQLAAFASGSGVQLHTLSEGCVAGFDFGTLYLARVANQTQRVRDRFEARLVSEPLVRSPRVGVWRVTGIIGNTPESLLTVDNNFAAVAVGDPLLVRIVEGFALDRFKKTSPALEGAALSTLPRELQAAPLCYYAPGPFVDDWAGGAEGVLARAFAIGAAATIDARAILQVHVVISGTFGPNLEDTRARLLKTWDTIQTSSVGRVLRLQETTEPSTINVRDNQATLDVKFPISSLMEGLSVAVSAEVTRIFDRR